MPRFSSGTEHWWTETKKMTRGMPLDTLQGAALFVPLSPCLAHCNCILPLLQRNTQLGQNLQGLDHVWNVWEKKCLYVVLAVCAIHKPLIERHDEPYYMSHISVLHCLVQWAEKKLVQELQRENQVAGFECKYKKKSKVILNSHAVRQPFQLDCGILVDEYSTSWPRVSADHNNEKEI